MVNKPNSNKARLKRHARVRSKISGTASCPRLDVFRSNSNIYAQLIDDVNGVTLAAASSNEKDFGISGGNIEGAQINLNGSILRTNASGQAVFNLRNGEYPYAVSAEGYRKQTGTVTINGAAQTPTITLVATK